MNDKDEKNEKNEKNEKKTNAEESMFTPRKRENEPKEEKVEAKVRQQVETPERTERTERVLLSTADAYIHDRLQSQPKNLDEIDVKVVDNEEHKHRLSLPDELVSYEKKYGFRWLFKHKQAIDYACDVRGWLLVNRTHFSELPSHCFSVSGSIERGDSILAFMPIEKAELIRREPGEKSRAVIKATYDKHKDDPNFYVPKEGTDEDGKPGKVRMI